MSDIAIAYVPVLHEGYRRFIVAHASDKPLYLVGPTLYAEYRPLRKDVRCLEADAARAAIDAWQICSQVSVLDEAGALDLSEQNPSITLPAEDISYQLVERYFQRCPVHYASAFLRWDKTRTVQMLEPQVPEVPAKAAWADVAGAAEAEAARSIDWWRQVGAALRLSDGTVLSASNVHRPDPLGPYVDGDPRANFYKGVHLDISTAEHAEAQLVARAARDGMATEGGVMYVTDFPCPPCARLIAAAGIRKLYFREGYAVLDGEAVLEAAGVEVERVAL